MFLKQEVCRFLTYIGGLRNKDLRVERGDHSANNWGFDATFDGSRVGAGFLLTQCCAAVDNCRCYLRNRHFAKASDPKQTLGGSGPYLESAVERRLGI